MRLALLINIFLALSINAFGLNAEESFNQIQSEIFKQQTTEGFWDGGLEADPSMDAFVLLFAEKMRLLEKTPHVREKILNRIFNTRDSQTGLWSQVPGGPPDISVTGTILLSLDKLGLARKLDPSFASAWDWFEKKGGINSLGACHKLFLAALGLLPRNQLPFLTTEIFALPLWSPMNIYNMGVYRTIVIPVIVWDYYHKFHFAKTKPLSVERRLSNGSQFAGGCGILCTTEFWAQEGLGWLLGHQQTDGHWYVLQGTMMSVLALKEAQDSGAGDFTVPIQKGIRAILNFEKRAANGTDYFQISSSSIWDTARVMTALGPDHFSEENKNYLLKTQALKLGEWSKLAPNVPPGGWSFAESQEHLYPDTDTAAAVMEALTLDSTALKDPQVVTAVKRGIGWLLGMQNPDGGFPAWDRKASKAFSNIFSVAIGQTVELHDVSQSDLSARVIKALTYLRSFPEFRKSIPIEAIQKTCDFLVAQPFPWRGDWWSNYIYATSEVTEALFVTGCRTLHQSIPELSWLVKLQNSDGGWGESIQSYQSKKVVLASSTLSQTSYVLRTLMTYEKFRRGSSLLPDYRNQIEKGIQFILNQVQADPSLKSYQEFTGVFIKGAMYANYRLLPYYETARVLRMYNELYDSQN